MELYVPPAPKRVRKERRLALVAPPPMEPGTTEMDDTWKNISEDILEVVMAWLPIATLFDFRSVSHRWNSLYTAPHFRQRWGEIATQKLPCLFSKDGGRGVASFYDPLMKKWHNTNYIPLSTSAIYPPCSAGGLVCFIDTMHTIFFVGNPLTQDWLQFSCSPSEVVRMQALGQYAVGMVSIPDQDSSIHSTSSRSSSKVVLIHKEGKYEVFSPKRGINGSPSSCTFMKSRIPAHIKLPARLNSRALSIGNVLYFMGSEPHGIISFNVARGEWRQELVPKPPNSTDLALVERKGRFLLMGVVMDRGAPVVSVRVWAPHVTTTMLMWMEIDRMPGELAVEFIGKPDVVFECLSNRRVVAFALGTSRMNRLFTYDLVSREWLRIPKPKIPGQKRQSIVGGVGVFPCFSSP